MDGAMNKKVLKIINSLVIFLVFFISLYAYVFGAFIMVPGAHQNFIFFLSGVLYTIGFYNIKNEVKN